MGTTIKIGHKLHLLQKKSLRLIHKSHYIAHTEPIFKKLNIVKIIDKKSHDLNKESLAYSFVPLKCSVVNSRSRTNKV